MCEGSCRVAEAAGTLNICFLPPDQLDQNSRVAPESRLLCSQKHKAWVGGISSVFHLRHDGGQVSLVVLMSVLTRLRC